MNDDNLGWLIFGIVITIVVAMLLMFIADGVDVKTAFHDGIVCKTEQKHQYICKFYDEDKKQVRIVFPGQQPDSVTEIEVR